MEIYAAIASIMNEVGAIGKDKQAGKLTYTALYGLENSKCKVVCLLDECYAIMNRLNIKSDILAEIVESIRKRIG